MAAQPLNLPGLDSASAESGALHILYGLVLYLRPALIVEAGTYRGHASCVMGGALRDGGIDGEVWTADVEGYDATETVERNGLVDHVRLFHGDFVDMLDGPLGSRRPRIAFIDSGAVYAEDGQMLPCEPGLRIRHVRAALRAVAPRGLVVVDDASGQWDGVEGLRGQASLYLSQGRGLAIVQRD